MATLQPLRRTVTRNHTGDAAVLRNPLRSGNCSISAASTAVSMVCCRLKVVDRRALPAPNQPPRSCARATCRRTTSRSPMRREANCEVPPCSLPEQRRIRVFPQFSMIDDEGMVVLLLTLLVGPVVGPHTRLDNQLVTLASVACQRFAHRTEGNEPDAGCYF